MIESIKIFAIMYLIISIIISAWSTKLFMKSSKSNLVDGIFYFVFGVMFWSYLLFKSKKK